MQHLTGTLNNLLLQIFINTRSFLRQVFGLASVRIWFSATLFALTFLFCAQAGAAGHPEFVLTSGTNHLVVNHIEYLVEPQPLNYLQASGEAYASHWQALTGRSFNFGNYHAPVWFRFDLANNSNSGQMWLLEVRHELLDRIEVVFYNPASGQWSLSRKSGNLLRSKELSVKNYQIQFPFSLPAGERNTVYLRVDSVHLFYVMLDVWQPEAFWPHNQQRTLLLGLFFGILVIMILYNVSLYIFTRDSNYLLYSAYAFAVVLYESTCTGIGGRYLWDDSFWLKQNAYILFALLSFLAGTLFIRQFLSLKKYGGWLLQLNNVFLAYFIIAAILMPFANNKIFFVIFTLAGVLAPIAGMVTCIYLWSKGNVQAKYYTIAYVILEVGTVILILSQIGIMEVGVLTEYSQMVGFVLEFVLLSIALADQINRDRAAREEAQRVSLELSEKMSKSQEEKLQIQEQMMAVQSQARQELELRVLERTEELEHTLKNLEQANQELSKLSITDPLTKVYNRRYFEEILSSEIVRASRIHQPLTVAIADLDHFKLINDNHGHLIGDECLRLVAKTLTQQLMRTGDFIARFGGEEFAIVLPSTNEENAMIVAERARAAVEGIYFIHRGLQVSLRVSIGVASWIPKPGESSEKLITAADKALYQAKDSGRNRVIIAGVQLSQPAV